MSLPGPILVADHTGALAERLAGIGAMLLATDAEGALALARSARPAVAVVHGDLPPEGGISLAGWLAPLATPVVLAAPQPDGSSLLAALRSGVRTVVGVDDEGERLRRAIEATLRRELFVSPGIAAPLRGLLASDPAGRHPFPQLSPRELDVLMELAAGADPARTALRLGLAPKTVRHHLARIQAKLGVSGHLQAARLARAAGLNAPQSR